jgi:starvation-inducible DNA-binding protein
MQVNIGISKEHLENSAMLLSAILADEMTLYIKTRKAHWNISGESFMELHKLFEGQYKQLEQSIDEVAERIGKLGHKTIGTMKEFMDLSSVKEKPGKYPSTTEMIAELLADHEAEIVRVRKYVDESMENKDAGTADFLTGLMVQHETNAWVLRRYLS